MTIKETIGLISIDEKPACIINVCAKDFCPTTDLALKLDLAYDIRGKIKSKFNFDNEYFDYSITRVAAFDKEMRAVCLVVGENHYAYYDYGALQIAFADLRDFLIQQNIKSIIMPMVGCDKNGLSYPDVKEIITYIFGETDIQIEIRDPRFIEKQKE